MDEAVAAFAEQCAELSRLLATVDDSGWRRPSRCEGWTVADVLLHLAQTNEMAIASVKGEIDDYLREMGRDLGPATSVDDGADLAVRRERDTPPPAIRDRWHQSAATFLDMVDHGDLHQRVTWVAGELSMRTLVTTRLAETWIHAGDIAEGLGIELEPAERLRHVARLAWRTLPYAFARAGRELAGPVEFELTGPTGEAWHFRPDAPAVTRIKGDGAELCLVAGRRLDPSQTGLTGEGPDADAVLDLVRTYA